MTNDRIIKSYVWHGDKCFFVSTIDRDSSAMLGPSRYNETIVWEYDWKTAERGKMLHKADDLPGSIRGHQRIVECLHKFGAPEEIESTEL